MITSEEKSILLKEISQILKEVRGAGPKTHSLKEIDNELHVIITGTLTPSEMYLFSTYGQEYIDTVYKFYYDSLERAVKRLDDALNNKYNFKLIRWEPDFTQNRMNYVLSINNKV